MCPCIGTRSHGREGTLPYPWVSFPRFFSSPVQLSFSSVGAADALLKKFKQFKVPPNLDEVHAGTIASCMLKFLRQLNVNIPTDFSITVTRQLSSPFQEPLIPTASWHIFVRSASVRDDGASLRTAIDRLPMPQRDTLAFLCLHWQKVAARSTVNGMTVENLAHCLAPCVVDFSSEGKADGQKVGWSRVFGRYSQGI
jgi:hypothetical protein